MIIGRKQANAEILDRDNYILTPIHGKIPTFAFLHGNWRNDHQNRTYKAAPNCHWYLRFVHQCCLALIVHIRETPVPERTMFLRPTRNTHLMQVGDQSIKRALAQYHKAGFVEIPNVLPPSVCEALNTALTDQSTTSFFDETDFGWLGQNAVKHVPVFAEALIAHPEFRICGSNLPEVLLFQDLIIWKPPKSKRQVEWHQDYSYWPVDQPSGITLWIALDQSNECSGTLRYIPRSHEWGECQPTIYTLESSTLLTKVTCLAATDSWIKRTSSV